MLISNLHLTYMDSVAAPAGIRAASEGRAGVSLKAKKRGGNDSLNLLKRGFSNFKRGGGLTSPFVCRANFCVTESDGFLSCLALPSSTQEGIFKL